MSASTRVLDLAVRRLADEPAAASHPTLDELAAYYHRSLQQAEAAAVQDHLVTCRECTARLLELDEIHEMGQEAVAPAGTPSMKIASVSEPSVSVSAALIDSGMEASSSPCAGRTESVGVEAVLSPAGRPNCCAVRLPSCT